MKDTNSAPSKPQTRKPRAGTPVVLIVERQFVGDKPMTEALIPIILEDLRQRMEQNRTFDQLRESA